MAEAELAELETTRMSSRGQIVIPQDMRKGFREGEKFVVMRIGRQLLLKSMNDFKKNIEEDIIFAHRTEEAWKQYERGEFMSLSADKFLAELRKC